MLNTIKGIAGKLRRIILLQYGLVTFRFAYMRTLKPFSFMISAFLDMSLSPKTNIIYLWRPQDTLDNPRKIPNHF